MKPKILPVKKLDEAGTVQLFIICRFNYKQVKFFTGERAVLAVPGKAKLGEWDERNECFFGKTILIKQKNVAIDKKVETLESIYREAELRGETVTPEYLRSEYEKVYPNERKAKAPVALVQKREFYDLIPAYVKSKTGILSDKHLRKFTQVTTHLNAFDPDLSLSKVNMEFYHNYLFYLINEAELANNTIKHHIDCIRAIMTYARILQIPVLPDFEQFSSLPSDTMRSYHTEAELELISRYETSAPGEQRAMDIYKFACYTGLRYNDVRNLKPANILGDILLITQHKGKNRNAIQLNDVALSVIEKYKGSEFCLPVISNFQTNQHIKAACKKMGIDVPTQKVTYSGSERREVTVPKYELIGFHTARHTFATISLRRGMKLEILQEILGHKSIDTTRGYAKIIAEEKHQAMKDVWNR